MKVLLQKLQSTAELMFWDLQNIFCSCEVTVREVRSLSVWLRKRHGRSHLKKVWDKRKAKNRSNRCVCVCVRVFLYFASSSEPNELFAIFVHFSRVSRHRRQNTERMRCVCVFVCLPWHSCRTSTNVEKNAHKNCCWTSHFLCWFVNFCVRFDHFFHDYSP